MKEALRNIWRRKARSALTIFGVGIGIFALVTMGALSQSLNKSIQVGIDYFSSRILVTKASGGFGGPFAIGPQLPSSVTDRIKVIDGVDRAYPTLSLTAKEDSELSFTSSPETIQGAPPTEVAKDEFKLELSEGRELKAGDTGKTVIGSNIVQKEKLGVGDTVKLRGKKFKVVGVLRRTTADPDSFYLVTLDDALELSRRLSRLSAGGTGTVGAGTEELVTNINVFPEEGVDSTKLTKRIESTISGVDGTPPEQLKKTLEDASAVFNLIVLGSALIAVLVGSLSVINTMIMSVTERRKEIGVKRVVGARARHILRETVVETGLIGLIGGVIGFLGSAGLVSIVNAITKQSGLELFLLTPKLAVVAIGFAVGLGVLAGIYPAWRATRIKPVNVLREE
ncbi:MAG: ABC transporter permease [bacterium]|nr:ABC transporter permease [bacterium]MDZ4247831.1 FtsX-like permease family protein [Patescibacteria group bacterium]